MDRSKQLMVLLVVAVAELLTTVMHSAVNVALKAIDGEWGVAAVTLSWIPLAYFLAAAAFLMPAGRLADLHGRKRFFVMGMVVFTVFTFASAFAPSAAGLIALRALQGIGTAILYACCTAMVALAFPPEKRGRAIGIQIACVYLGLALGPLLGGAITDNLGWRYIFVFVGVAGALNSFAAWRGLREIEWREPAQGGFDVTGSIAWAVALTVFLVGLSWLPGATGWVLAVVGAVGVGGFLWWETKVRAPILNVELFRKSRVFLYSNGATLLNYAAIFAVFFLMGLYLTFNRDLSATGAGLIIASQTVIQAVFSPAAGWLADRVRPRRVATVGMAICVLALAAFVFLGDSTSYWYVIAALCVLGLGQAFFSSPMVVTIMGSVDGRYTGVASATIATMRMTGQNISMGLAAVVLAVVVGRREIGDADLPGLLTSVRVTFAILAVLCVLGVAATLVGPRRSEAAAGAVAGGAGGPGSVAGGGTAG